MSDRDEIMEELDSEDSESYSEESDHEDVDTSEKMEVENSKAKPEDDYGVSICYDVLDSAFCTKKYMTPVSHQGAVDSCVAFTISAALGALIVVESKYCAPLDFCKQEVVDCLPIVPGIGGIPYLSGFRYVYEHDLFLEKFYPYEGKYFQRCRRDDYLIKCKAFFGTLRILEDPDEILRGLHHQPLAAGLPLYASFCKHRDRLKSDADLLGVYRPDEGECQLTSDSGVPLRHAVLVIGFSKHPEPCFIIKNWSDTSWGARVMAVLQPICCQIFTLFKVYIGKTKTM